MSFPEPMTERQARVAAAFHRDGFAVTRTAEKDGFLGVAAEHRSARIGASTRPKRAFYLEGDNYQMGFLLGLLARDDVMRMTHEFLQNVVFSFFDSKAAGARGVSSDLRRLIVRVALSVSRDVLPDIPKEYLEEIQGIVDGCDAGGRGSDVTRDALITLNFGIDAVLAHVYSGSLFARKGFRPEMLRTPIGCNAFFIGGEAAGGKCFLGRDFMFPTANVYQDTACLIVYRPSPRGGKVRHPFVSQTAPGIVGSMTGMNAAGVAMGVNMLPTGSARPKDPGSTLFLSCVTAFNTAGPLRKRWKGSPRPSAEYHGCIPWPTRREGRASWRQAGSSARGSLSPTSRGCRGITVGGCLPLDSSVACAAGMGPPRPAEASWHVGTSTASPRSSWGGTNGSGAPSTATGS